jgi:hypothetical protein
MSTDDRLTRLRALIARLERLPASPESAWMLGEARARLVDVETGERPRGMRPLAVDPPPVAPRRADAGAATRRQPRPIEPETAVSDGTPAPDSAGATLDASGAPFGIDGLLSLEDPANGDAAFEAGQDGDAESRPWRRGLRG